MCSLGHGAAGVAYFLLRYGRLVGDEEALDAASGWIGLAERDLKRPEAFVGRSPVFPDRRFAFPPSLHFGDAGVWCVAALVHDALGDREGARAAVARFAAAADTCPPDALDVTWGAAGLLLGTAVLVEELDDTSLVPLGERLAERLIRDPDPVGWLGAAHGSCGVAHALLRWCEATNTSADPPLLRLLDRLRAARLPSGLWPRQVGSNEVWPGWCHGSAGWVQLWTLAAEVLDDDGLLDLARVAGEHAIDAGDSGGGGLCCGRAGAAYAALALHQAARDDAWLGQARRLAEEAARTPIGEWFPEHSLWRGHLGAALLALELSEPGQAAMPLYRRPG